MIPGPPAAPSPTVAPSLATAPLPPALPLRRVLTELAEARSTGALHVAGSPGGTWYFIAGRITHAASPACPDVGERLVNSGRLSAQTWQEAFDAGYADHTVGRHLIRGGHLVQGELVCRVIAAICDVTHAILQSDDAPVRFVPDERHWLGLVTQIELTALSRETARRRLLAKPAAKTPRTLQDLEPNAPWAGRGRSEGRSSNAGPATVDVVPEQRRNVRPEQRGTRQDGENSGFADDYATLKRIRRALTSIG